MSNHLAIAAVTVTLQQLLADELSGDGFEPHYGAVPGAPAERSEVTALRPDQLTQGLMASSPILNVWMYSVTPNAALSNIDLPIRNAAGVRVCRTSIALDLHYLISAHGDEESLEPQRILGRAVLGLARNAVLTRQMIRDAIAEASVPSTMSFLAKSDLADAPELVKLTPSKLSLEEMSKLWSVLLQTPYELSMAYTASVVVLEDEITPRVALPVTEPAIHVSALGRPRIARIVTTRPDGTARSSELVEVVGSSLLAETTSVRLGDVEVAVEPGATPGRLVVRVPGALPAGTHTVRVIQRSVAGPPHRVIGSSNEASLTVRPSVTLHSVDAASIVLDVTPAIDVGQRVVVELTSLAEPPLTTVVRNLGAAAVPTATVTAPRTGIAAGDWLIRLRVGGTSSDVTKSDPAGRYDGPSVTAP